MTLLRAVLAAAVILGGGYLHGRWTNRWGLTEAIQAISSRFDSIPLELNGWKGESAPIDARTLRLAGGSAAFQRIYRDSAGNTVDAFLIGGKSSAIASHTPDVCYPGAGFRLEPTQVLEVALPGGATRTAQVATAIATRGSADQMQKLRIYWAWNDGEGWRAPEDARWAYATRPVLCKAYVVIPQSRLEGVDPANGPALDLVAAILTQYGQTLYPGASPARNSADEATGARRSAMNPPPTATPR